MCIDSVVLVVKEGSQASPMGDSKLNPRTINRRGPQHAICTEERVYYQIYCRVHANPTVEHILSCLYQYIKKFVT